MKKLFINAAVCFVLLITVSIGYSECEGDINCSGGVDGTDLAMLATDFGTTGCGTCDDVITRMEELEDKVALLEELLQHFSRNGNDIYIEGANIHVLDGSGNTDGSVNGLGNLIVGYNETRGSGDDRTGSHNIVVGMEQNYSSHGGLVAGRHNTISGEFSAVTGGRYNTASGNFAFVGGGGLALFGTGNEAFSNYSAILGGRGNTAGNNSAPNDHSIGEYATVSGGLSNTASGKHSSVSGGSSNEASGEWASVSGGQSNTATNQFASVNGGSGNTASGSSASISGGRYNKASGDYSFVGGGGSEYSGYGNEAFSNYSAILGGAYNIAGNNSNSNDHSIGESATVSGGFSNRASGWYSSISGGEDNTASGRKSSVSGGYNRSVSSEFDWRAGSLFENE